MNILLFSSSLHVPRHQPKTLLTALRRTARCCAQGTGKTRATQRSQQPIFSDTTHTLSQQLVADGILDPSDAKLFETFTESRANLFLRVLNNRTRHVTFVLDGVHGAHNLAAIARSCDAWGVQDLHLIAQSRTSGDGKAKKVSLIERFKNDRSVQNVSKSSHKWLTINEYSGVDPCIQKLKSAGYKVLVSSLSPSATPIQEIDASEKSAFVFGNEKDGVSKEMEALSDGLFTIPMMGFVESMNVSVAVGTTASLTITRAKASIPANEYMLSKPERNELARTWLKNRFSKEGPSKMLRNSQDVTRLGPECERRVIEDGLFEKMEDHFLDSNDRHVNVIRLHPDTGTRLATYVSRRKFGALGDGRFDKRCSTITYCLAGAHALSCRAALEKYESIQISKSTLFRYFTKTCEQIADLYSPYFDESGNPILPKFAPESQDKFDSLVHLVAGEALTICQELARDIFGLDAKATQRIIERASYLDLSRCVTDTLRLSSKMSNVFMQQVTDSLHKLPDLLVILQERESVHTLIASCNCKSISSYQHSSSLNEAELAVLQIFLRLSHAAFLSSEIHQATWDRWTTHLHLARIHSLRFALLESILSEAWAESATIPCFSGMGPLRLVVEWDQILAALKSSLKSHEFRGSHEHGLPETDSDIHSAAEATSMR